MEEGEVVIIKGESGSGSVLILSHLVKPEGDLEVNLQYADVLTQED